MPTKKKVVIKKNGEQDLEEEILNYIWIDKVQKFGTKLKTNNTTLYII